MKLLFKKGKFNILLPRILDFIASLDEDKEYELTIGKKEKEKSNEANAYYWVLIGKLSAKISIPPVEIYRTHIKDIGGNYDVVPIREDVVDAWIKRWKKRGLGWQCDIVGDSKFRGYKNVICYYGSSEYTSKQMSRLIDLCIQDCKEQGIETMTPSELARLMEDYKES